ncbi:hypothetical protein [Thiobacillus denitrificans]|nr:hypothetical protein [Thiobacillus denitrificans]
MRSSTIETSWGRVRVTGRLGQAHADVFEAICYERIRKGEMADGRIKLLVDPAAVRRRARITSGTQFEAILQDLRMADIEILAPARLACAGHLIDHIDKAQRSDGSYVTRANPLGGDRHLWRVEIGKAFCRLVESDIWVGHDPGTISLLQHGISQAVARHALTHKTEPQGGWLLDGLIRAVAGEVAGDALWNKRRELRADTDRLAEIGIVIDGDRVHSNHQGTPVAKAREPVAKAREPVAKARRPVAKA